MGQALQMYVDEQRKRYPHYVGPPGLADGDAKGKGGRPTDWVYWSSKLFPYYPMTWTNAAYHCPGYKGAITGPAFVSKGAVDRLGSYAYSGIGAGDGNRTHVAIPVVSSG